MRKIIFALLVSVSAAFAQAPKLFNYQGVARDKDGLPLGNKELKVRLSIIDIVAGEPVTTVYIENHTKSTNAFGLFTIEVGGGTPEKGEFGTINWTNGSKTLTTEIDADGNGYTVVGQSTLLSVPYALSAKTVEREKQTLSLVGTKLSISEGNTIELTLDPSKSTWVDNNGNINYTIGNVGIGTTTPAQKLDVKGKVKISDVPLSPGSTKILVTDSTGVVSYRDVNSITVDGQWTGVSGGVVYAKNVGIGTLTPSEKLDVNGKVRVSDLPVNDTAAKILIANSKGVLGYRNASTLGSNGKQLWTEDSVSISPFMGKNVSVSTLDVTYGKLDVSITGRSNADAALTLKINEDNTQTDLRHINGTGATPSGQAGETLLKNKGNGLVLNSSESADSKITFVTGGAAAATASERMRIDNIGNVGIGTPFPTQKLDVAGAVKISNLPANDTAAYVVVANNGGILGTRKSSTLGGGLSPLWLQNGKDLNPVSSTNRVNVPSLKIVTNKSPYPGLAISEANDSSLTQITLNTGTSKQHALISHTGDNFTGGIPAATTLDNRGNGLLLSSSGTSFSNISFWSGDNLAANYKERMRLDNTGNLGIGTQSPTEKLDVEGKVRIANLPANDTAAKVVIAGANGVLGYRNVSTLGGGGTGGQWTNVTGGINFSLGNVGVGTISPSQKLDVNGKVRISDLPVNDTAAKVVIAGANGVLGYRNASSLSGGGTNYWTNATASGELSPITPQQVLLTSLRVNNPTGATVTIETPDQTSSSSIYLNAGSARNGLSFGQYGDGNTNKPGTSFITSYGNGLSLISRGSDIIFETGPQIGTSERMRLDVSGNLGLGTTTPTQKLDVNGKVRITDLPVNDTAAKVVITGANGVLGYRNVSTLSGGGTGGQWSDVTGGINFGLGNVGVGTLTPSQKLDVNGKVRISDLPVNDTAAKVVIADANGVLGYRKASTFGGAGNSWTSDGTTLSPTTDKYVHVDGLEISKTIGEQRVDVTTKDKTASSFMYFNSGGTYEGISIRQYGNDHPSKPAISEIRSFGMGLSLVAENSPVTFSSGKAFSPMVEKMRMDIDGNFGIGTSTPTQKLDVNGKVRIADLAVNDTASKVVITEKDGTLGFRNVSSLSGGASLWKQTGTTLAPTSATVTTEVTALTIKQPLSDDRGFKFTHDESTRWFIQRMGSEGNLRDNFRILHNGLKTGGNLIATSILTNYGDGLVLGSENSPLSNISFVTGDFTKSLERMRIANNGNVGIGTTTPTQKLDVNGGARIQDLKLNDAATKIVIAEADGTLGYRDASTLGGSGTAVWKEAAGIVSPVNSVSSVAVAQLSVTDPTGLPYKFFVSNDKSNVSSNLVMNAGETTTRSILSHYGNTSTMGVKGSTNLINEGNALVLTSRNTANSYISLVTGGTINGSEYEKVRITQIGKVGIGTSDPQEALHVNGAVRIEDLALNEALTRVVVADADGKLHTRSASTLTGGGSSSLWKMVSGELTPLNADPVTVNKLTVNNTGTATIDIASEDPAGEASIRLTANTTNMGLSIYQTGGSSTTSPNLSTIRNSGSGLRLASQGAGGIQFSTGGLRAEFEHMRLDPNGNLGIGTDIPTQRLDVNGKVRIQNLGLDATSDKILVAGADGVLGYRAASTLGGGGSSNWTSDGTFLNPVTGISAVSMPRAVITSPDASGAGVYLSLDKMGTTSTARLQLQPLPSGTGAPSADIFVEDRNGLYVRNYGGGIHLNSFDGEISLSNLGSRGGGGEVLRLTQNGDMYMPTAASGIIMKSPDGTCFRVAVSNAGVLSTPAKITCP